MVELAERLGEIEPEWAAALADAGFEAREARLYLFPGVASENGYQAYYFAPGQLTFRDPRFPDDTGNQIRDANAHTNRHRIAAWADADIPVLGAKLRHELEHARQHDVFGRQLVDLNDLIGQVIAHKVGGLRGGAFLYNFNPVEVDCNAAAARFAWGRYGEVEARERLKGDDAALFRSLTPPADIATLPKRMLCFLAQFPELCEMEAAARGHSFEELLATAWPGMEELWRGLNAI